MKKLMLLLSLLLVACSQEKAGLNVSGGGKGTCMIVKIDDMPPPCKDGDLFLFLPQVYGSQQIPVLIAGYFCDFRYPIVWTEGGVACIFTSARINNMKKEQSQ